MIKHPIHDEADRFEPRFARAYVKAMRTLRGLVDREALATAIKMKDVRRALMAVPDGAAVADALQPVTAIVKDAVTRGGKVGAEAINTKSSSRFVWHSHHVTVL